jgi:hypothetical protein
VKDASTWRHYPSFVVSSQQLVRTFEVAPCCGPPQIRVDCGHPRDVWQSTTGVKVSEEAIAYEPPTGDVQVYWRVVAKQPRPAASWREKSHFLLERRPPFNKLVSQRTCNFQFFVCPNWLFQPMRRLWSVSSILASGQQDFHIRALSPGGKRPPAQKSASTVHFDRSRVCGLLDCQHVDVQLKRKVFETYLAQPAKGK